MEKYALILDGSAILCTQYYGTNPLSSPSGEPTNGVYGFMKFLSKLLVSHKPEYLAVCWDVSRKTFRKQEFEAYKGNRDETPDDLKKQFITCQNVLREFNIPQFFSKDYEADDFAGTLAKKFENEIPIRIVTKDKDYFQLISENTHIWKICNKMKDWENLLTKYGIDKSDVPEKLFEIDPDMLVKEYGYSSDKVTLLKGLMGDSSDNIPGIKGIGEKSAITLVNTYDSIEDIYSNVEGKSDKEIDAWKKSLKLTKRVVDALLLEETDYGMTNKELGILSKKLATIKTDIDIDTRLEDLALNIDSTKGQEALQNLGIKTIKL